MKNNMTKTRFELATFGTGIRRATIAPLSQYKKKIFATTGNRTRVSCVTGRNTNRYTIATYIFFCPHAGLNHRPSHYKCDALPLCYMGAHTVGFEPTRETPNGLAGRRLNHSARCALIYIHSTNNSTSAGSRTRIPCLEGKYTNRCTTDVYIYIIFYF